MKKTKLLSKTLLGSLLLGSVLVTDVYAEDTATSDARIEFTAPTDSPVIYQPDAQTPADVQDPAEDDQITGSTGPLTIDYVSNLDFGTHEIDVAEATYLLDTPETPYVQLSDRRGTQAGWNLSVQASTFTNDGVDTLNGAFLSFNNGDVRTNLDNVTPPTTTDFQVTAGGDAATVTNAAQGEGIGTWLTVWNNPDVSLTIPQGAASEGVHTSTLTWTLSDAPGA